MGVGRRGDVGSGVVGPRAGAMRPPGVGQAAWPAGPARGVRPRLRWVAAPVLAGGMIVGGLVSPGLARASAPSLPSRSPAGVLELALGAHVPTLQGTFVVAPHLGLSALGSALSGVGESVPTVLTQTTTVRIYLRPGYLRLEEPGSLSEKDLYVSPSGAWLWNSATDSATRLRPVRETPGAEAGRSSGTDRSSLRRAGVGRLPETAITAWLRRMAPLARLRVAGTATVAGQPAYLLVLTPATTGSLVRDVEVAIDAANGLVLRVVVRATDGTEPALTAGFQSLSLAAPSLSAVTFRPPAGARVTTRTVGRASALSEPAMSEPAMSRAAMSEPAMSQPKTSIARATDGGGVRSVGRGFSRVVEVSLPNGLPPALRTLLAEAPEARGSFGVGRLVTTRLVDALVLSNGRVVLGPVDPAVLEAAAARLN
jgi:hypothetical protein